MVRILHLGAREIDFNRPECEILNLTSQNKPIGNILWGSSLIKLPGGKVNSSWKDYVSGDYIEKDSRYGVSFTLNRKTKILEITDLYDYLLVMEKYSCFIYPNDNKRCLDFVKISKDYDAFHLTEDAFWELRSPIGGPLYDLKYADFYSYDAESWVIFNLDCINKGSILNHNNIVSKWEVIENYDY